MPLLSLYSATDLINDVKLENIYFAFAIRVRIVDFGDGARCRFTNRIGLETFDDVVDAVRTS